MITKRTLMAGLAATAALPSLVRAETGAEYIRVPITVKPNGRVLIPVTINDTGPYPFVMDTGASSSCIRDDIAKRLNLPLVDGRTAHGIGGIGFDARYRAKSVVFGTQLRQGNVSLDGLKVAIGPDQDGLIAAGFLTTYPSELDYGLREIRIFTHGQPDLTGYITLDSSLEGQSEGASPRIFVRASIDGIPLKLLVDTGAPSELLLHPQVVREHGLWDKYPDAKASRTAGVTGIVTPARDVTMPNFVLGDIAVPHLPVRLMDPTSQDGDGNPVNGILGSNFLKLFSMAVLNNGLRLRPNARTVLTPDTPAPAVNSGAATS